MTVTHGPVVIRRRLGHVLKQLRTAKSLQLGEVARDLEISPSKLSRIETGQVEPKFRDVRDLLDRYEAADDVRSQVLDWASEAKSPGWWQPLSATVAGADLNLLISLEAEACRKRTFCMPVTGLLQTEAYARSLFAVGDVGLSAVEIENLVEIRRRRQEVISPGRSDAPPLELHVVLDEAALHRINDPGVMRDQIRLLLERSEQPNITLQILPFSAGWTSAISTFSIFTPRHPETDWPVVNLESTESDSYYDSESAVAGYEAVWRNVLAHALDVDATGRVLRRQYRA
ncbi:helix-turn-helix domain-containing protein [Pseudonocardia sp. C8]|uniref:helix-turn-helix domain-containing protein n=1 Tax=Pseudonocardia sp. C8 TaxID=2762759 RepID=UPI0016434958|nr:helix-turn-helix transcriptional regulator [Pseudonocardia sp. C8]MBC3194253.1 helix-turn-helix domain-containing protein [Pseudonocardia sp. C8]